MHVRALLFVLSLLGSLDAAAAQTFAAAAEQLNGSWRGGEFVLRVDARRAQASIDPAHPFEWEHFLIKEVREDEIVFAIGAELYEAKVDSNILTLTGTDFRGERVLFRDGGLRGTSQ